MEFISLQIQNFLTIGTKVEINLSNKGLVLVQGVNEDDTSAGSNGAGKSTIADALSWVNYDKTARDESGDAIINNKAGKDCYVREVIKDGSVTYDITRYRKHKEFKNQTVVNVWNDPNGTSVTNISKGTEKETQVLINEILGCSHEVFIAAIYAGQEATPDIPRMTDKQLKLLIEEAAGVERLETAYEVARKDAMLIQDKITAVSTHKLSIDTQLESLGGKLTHAQEQFKLFEDARQAKADQHKQAAINLANDTKVLVSEIALNQREALESSLAELKSQVDAIGLKQDELKQITQLHNSKKVGIQNQAFVLNAAKKEREGFQSAHDNAEVKMLEPCKACGKPHDASEIDDFKKHQLGEVATLDKRVDELVADIDALTKSFTEHAKLVEAKQLEVDALNPQDIFSRTNQINAELANIKDTENKIANNKATIQRYMENSKLCITEPNPHAGVVEFIEADIQTRFNSIAEVKAKMLELEDEATIAESIVKVFGPAGVRAHILDTVTPFLNDRTSEYLSALSDGNITATWTTITKTAKGELREKFNLEVSNSKGGKSFKLLSGGEKRKVRLSAMLALQDLVASRATKPIGIWLGDEIDDAMDDAGLERLMVILERKARERGTVLVISHSNLKDWVDNVITVTKRNGQSTLEGALCQ